MTELHEHTEPLPPELELVLDDLQHAAHRLHGRRVARKRRLRTAAIAASLVVLGTAGAVAAVPGVRDSVEHLLFEPDGKRGKKPVDDCVEHAGGVLLVCESAVGGEYRVRDDEGGWAKPGRCHTYRAACLDPYPFIADFSNRDMPRLRRVSVAEVLALPDRPTEAEGGGREGEGVDEGGRERQGADRAGRQGKGAGR